MTIGKITVLSILFQLIGVFALGQGSDFETPVDQRVNHHLRHMMKKIEIQKNQSGNLRSPRTPKITSNNNSNVFKLETQTLGVSSPKNQPQHDPEVMDIRDSNQDQEMSFEIDQENIQAIQRDEYNKLYEKKYIEEVKRSALKSGYKLKMQGTKIIDVKQIHQ